MRDDFDLDVYTDISMAASAAPIEPGSPTESVGAQLIRMAAETVLAEFREDPGLRRAWDPVLWANQGMDEFEAVANLHRDIAVVLDSVNGESGVVRDRPRVAMATVGELWDLPRIHGVVPPGIHLMGLVNDWQRIEIKWEETDAVDLPPPGVRDEC